MTDCPICKNDTRVYFSGDDPVYKNYVLCELHGIQVVEEREQKEKGMV